MSQSFLCVPLNNTMSKNNRMLWFTFFISEEDKRFSIFCDNMRKARKLQETEKGSAIYGATQFADLTGERII